MVLLVREWTASAGDERGWHTATPHRSKDAVDDTSCTAKLSVFRPTPPISESLHPSALTRSHSKCIHNHRTATNHANGMWA
jgi:hypothetical protein